MRVVLPHLAALAAASVLAACGGVAPGQPQSLPELTASPMPTSAPTPPPTDSGPTPPSDTATSDAPIIERDPDDGDRGAFIRGYQPEGAIDLDALAEDVDGDGVREVVVTYVESGQVQLDVAWWNGSAYEVDTMLDGGSARHIDGIVVRDVNADGAVEIVVEFTGEGSFGGVSIWGVNGNREVAGLIAVGGCHSGRSTYGAIGADLVDLDGDGAREIRASCDDSPLPLADWTTDVYAWSDGAYRIQRQVTSTPNVDDDPDQDDDDPDHDGDGSGDGQGDPSESDG